jgi:two-component system sensor histidine kinase KdpD
MKKGRLRVLLGAAPGVGKTYAMLEEGTRLKQEGKDVVIAIVETHGRALTAALLEGQEIIPRSTVTHRGVQLTEMDLDAVIARKPDIALVDELAHTNAPGFKNEKRWQDVVSLLEAGIDVISTVNVQHIESLRDVVEQITGAPQRETVPDSVLREADQIEVIDLAPQSLRDRLAEGHVYPANRIDAALSNYFRLGNLTALRELALLWLADEVDTALKAYRTEKGIDSKWEARERVVVALTGGPEGETLVRRGARIAARSAGGELIAVHITSQDGLADSHPGALSAQRALTEKLGGTYHQVIGDDIPRALVDFAKGANATQLVIGVSRRSRAAAALTGPGTAATVIRESGNIDVHIVNHSAAGGQFALPHLGGALTVRRRVIGFIVALLGGPAVTAILFASRSPDSITADVLGFQLLVVAVALIGGIWPALFAAVLSGLTLDYFFVKPYLSITIAVPLHFLTLILYVLNALLVSYVVDQAARRSRSAQRAQAESQLLATITGSVFRGQDALQALVSRTREAFSLTGVRLLAGEELIFQEGDVEGEPVASIPTGERGTLELFGGDIQASERRLLSVIAAQIDAALEYRDLSATAQEIGPLTENDRMRSALLAAVGHDLRRPLAAATAAVTGLRSPGMKWSDGDRDELLATAQESLESLSALVTNLLDVSRLQAGSLAVSATSIDVADVVLPALDELDLGPGDVDLDLPADLCRPGPATTSGCQLAR